MTAWCLPFPTLNIMQEADSTRDPGLLEKGVITLKDLNFSWLIILFLMESEIVNKLGHILWEVLRPPTHRVTHLLPTEAC